jgi:hypothetical protein
MVLSSLDSPSESEVDLVPRGAALMTDPSWTQPSLPLGPPPALRLLLEVLLDPQEERAVLSIEARTYPDKQLVALCSRGEVHYSDIEYHVRELGFIFTRLIREHTDPFPE